MNNSSASAAQRDELAELKNKYRILTAMVFGLALLWAATILLQFTNSAKASENDEPAKIVAAPTPETLRVREIVVIDERGTERVRIGAPLPDPIMLGKRSKRNGNVAGIMLYDGEGNERGGYVTGERSIALTFDEINRMSMHLGVNDKGAMHFMLSDGRGNFAGMGVLPTGPWLQMFAPGKPPVIFPVPAETEKKPAGEKDE